LFLPEVKRLLTSRICKELYGEFERQRNEALKDSSGFVATGQDYSLEDLGITIEGGGVNDPETYLIDTQPVDPNTDAKMDKVDIRQLPGHD
jgi:hypothetical protein